MAAYNFGNIGCEKAKERYAAKLANIEMDCCPYQLPADAWVNDSTHWPPLEWCVHEGIHEKQKEFGCLQSICEWLGKTCFLFLEKKLEFLDTEGCCYAIPEDK